LPDRLRVLELAGEAKCAVEIDARPQAHAPRRQSVGLAGPDGRCESAPKRAVQGLFEADAPLLGQRPELRLDIRIERDRRPHYRTLASASVLSCCIRSDRARIAGRGAGPG